MNKRTVGTQTEARASDFLTGQGLHILEHSYRCRIGEIDLIAAEADGTVVFVEVKYRRTDTMGLPEEAVGRKKQETIRRTALRYLTERSMPPESAVRFDVIAMDTAEIRWYKNAF
ncbi:MAG: YraN family protein [Lachnospiraceae bacterium]|nr:YraN family protein [Lachnospiraceae bacterium]